MKPILAQLEAALALILAWILVFVVPFRWTRRLFGALDRPDDRTDTIDPASLARARAVTARLRRVADRLPWTSTCLVRALAGRMVLARRGLTGGIVRFGVRRDETGIAAHAWLMLGPAILLGGESAADFQPLADLSSSPD